MLKSSLECKDCWTSTEVLTCILLLNYWRTMCKQWQRWW